MRKSRMESGSKEKKNQHHSIACVTLILVNSQMTNILCVFFVCSCSAKHQEENKKNPSWESFKKNKKNASLFLCTWVMIMNCFNWMLVPAGVQWASGNIPVNRLRVSVWLVCKSKVKEMALIFTLPWTDGLRYACRMFFFVFFCRI